MNANSIINVKFPLHQFHREYSLRRFGDSLVANWHGLTNFPVAMLIHQSCLNWISNLPSCICLCWLFFGASMLSYCCWQIRATLNPMQPFNNFRPFHSNSNRKTVTDRVWMPSRETFFYELHRLVTNCLVLKRCKQELSCRWGWGYKDTDDGWRCHLEDYCLSGLLCFAVLCVCCRTSWWWSGWPPEAIRSTIHIHAVCGVKQASESGGSSVGEFCCELKSDVNTDVLTACPGYPATKLASHAVANLATVLSIFTKPRLLQAKKC